uniref:fimbria/pilus outer membrane usher protein n=1 Tax=Klebsiella sp. TaxID=576 RepID=UPI00258B261F|nr:fimbria/pilus outer membrane usher protein [Klebsiella sp.]
MIRSCNFKPTPLVVAISLGFSPFAIAQDADEVQFNSTFMSQGSQKKIDLTHYEHNLAVPGKYRVELRINNQYQGFQDITVSEGKPPAKTGAICLTTETWRTLPLNIEKLSDDAQSLLANSADDACLATAEIIPQVTSEFDPSNQTLDLAIPALYLVRNPRGYVNPVQWNKGVTAGLLTYNANYYHQQNRGTENESAYSGITTGFNLGNWYFRHNGNWSWQDDIGSHYQALNSYVQRDIPAIKGRLTLGDRNTRGELFDTLAFRGIQLANEEQMLPDSQRGYAPIVRGTARTSAKVQIFQQGRLLYETAVSPGPFEINDLYPTGYGGDLQLVIKEADGSEQQQTIPYAATSNLLRSGTNHYSVTMGKLRKDQVESEPFLGELTWRRGLNNFFTGYAGLQGNEDYQAGMLGVALGTPVGTFSLDATQAQTQLDKPLQGYSKRMSGQSYQLKYSQFIMSTGSNFSVAAYRYSTEEYLDFMTAMQIRDAQKYGDDTWDIHRPKSRLNISASQNLPEGWGNFYLNVWQQDYWDANQGTDRQYQFGYNNALGRVSYGLSMSRNRNGDGDYENHYQLTLSIPLGNTTPFSQMSMNLNHDPGGAVREQLGLSGTALEDSSLSYGLSASNSNKGDSTSGSLNTSLRSSLAMLQAQVGTGKHYSNYSFGISGGAVAHSGGVTLTPYTADTMALVEAKGAQGAKVSGYPGVTVDRFGYAIVPYLNAYQINQIEIDPKGISENVELENTSQKIAPYSGAVVKLHFDTVQGQAVMIQLTNGQMIPFGADVLDAEQNVVGVVGQGQRIFARLAHISGQLWVSWGDSKEDSCAINYSLPASSGTEIVNINAECR